MIPRGVFLTAVLVVGGIAAAAGAIPNSDQVISGCYTKASGVLRVIDTEAAQKCKASEAALSWNQVGLKGEAGETGPVGPAGEQGPAGEPGASGAQEVFFANASERGEFVPTSGTLTVVSKEVPAGNYVLEARVSVDGVQLENDQEVSCGIGGSDGSWSTAGLIQENDGGATSVEVTYATEHPGGTMRVACRRYSRGNLQGFVVVTGGSLLATRVASVG